VPKKQLDEITKNRFTTIFTLIDTHLKKIKRDGLLPAGIILTGGGSGSPMISDVAKAILELPARTATLEIGKNTKVKDASWAVAYGLCMWGASDRADTATIGIVKQTKHTLFSWLTQFLP
jgi:cell division protein FtsA